MVFTFSKRLKLYESKKLDPNDMPISLRNRIWNAVAKYIDDSYPITRSQIIELLWDRFFKRTTDELQYSYVLPAKYYLLNQIKSLFQSLEWNKVYDLLELLLTTDRSGKNDFILKLNDIFIDENVSFRIIDNLITPLITPEEVETIEEGLESKYSSASNHIKKALELYSKRPEADYKNSIKESISAVEALARIKSNKPSATLGDLTQQLNIHPSFKKAITSLYGWTSDESGIRHSEKEDKLLITDKEARFMLVVCAAFVNYIIATE